MQTAAASLVAAIPAGILATLLVMMFLTQAGNLPTMLMVIAGSTLVASAMAVLMPFGILLFSGKSATKAAPKAAGKAGAKASADDGEAEVSGSDELLASEDEEFGETVVFDPDSSSNMADFADSEIEEETDEDVFADEEEIEEELPKKKGKKKK